MFQRERERQIFFPLIFFPRPFSHDSILRLSIDFAYSLFIENNDINC